MLSNIQKGGCWTDVPLLSIRCSIAICVFADMPYISGLFRLFEKTQNYKVTGIIKQTHTNHYVKLCLKKINSNVYDWNLLNCSLKDPKQSYWLPSLQNFSLLFYWWGGGGCRQWGGMTESLKIASIELLNTTREK